MQKHPTKSRRYLCDNPENIVVSFGPPDANRKITFGFKADNIAAMNVINDQIHFQMGPELKVLYIRFAFLDDSGPRCNIEIEGSSGGSFKDTPSINPKTADGKIRIYTFE